VLTVLSDQKLRLKVDDVDERTLSLKLKAATNHNFARAVYIAASPEITTGDDIHAVDLVKSIDSSLPVVLITPAMEHEAPACR